MEFFMEKLIDKIISEMKANDSLTDDEEIIRTGLDLIFSKLFFTIMILFMGLILNCFWESVVFTVSFSLLREYGGGYHAETRKKCFMLSILTLAAALSIIKLVENFQLLTFPFYGIALVSVIYILLNAPIDTLNKRFDDDEIKVYGKRARLLTVIISAIAALLWCLRLGNFTFSILTGIIVEAYLMIKGQISNSINREEV